ncbi:MULTISPECIES: hypothetical protein [Nostocales]|uniref:Uncharacterized protein n=2 Tax=Calothrix TaxID=1186 RepID=A0ABR8AKL7_9CYAN|nr:MULTISPECIES: hypothetical protein [Nostocales]MBD2199823.1 hypothetical protein [Calothrix parietina FACHB-288]MBD2228664.1 hypothetical protein [Calothrix anomala FACHB-343]MBD2354809.1 hypothetical protein [Tolypothrix sp. FACHB-123]
MRLIKKSEKLLLNKIKGMEEIEETNIQDDIIDAPESIALENQILDVESREPNYIPLRDNPVVQSVGNTGWQVSEIWKDIRLDNF